MWDEVSEGLDKEGRLWGDDHGAGEGRCHAHVNCSTARCNRMQTHTDASAGRGDDLLLQVYTMHSKLLRCTPRFNAVLYYT